jgi:hypothetical protein
MPLLGLTPLVGGQGGSQSRFQFFSSPRALKCEGCISGGTLRVGSFSPTGSEVVGLRIRRLVAIKIQRMPVWRDG